jgi:hypothetical protein
VSLIDTLREVAADIPPSHVPTPAELPSVVGALLTFVEHGEEAFKEASQGGFDGIVKLLAPPPEDPAPEQPAPAAPPPAADPAASDQLAELQAQNAELQKQLQALLAGQQHPTATVTPEPPPAAPADVTPPPAVS